MSNTIMTEEAEPNTIMTEEAEPSVIKKVALVACGSFNPPTLMHCRMFHTSRTELKKLGLEVTVGILSPVHDSYKKKGLANVEHRLAMLNLSYIEDWLIVSDWEAQQASWSRTVTVLDHHQEELKSQNKSEKIMLLCGADNLFSFSNPNIWNPDDLEKILSVYGVVVCTRYPMTKIEVEEEILKRELLAKYKDNIIVVEEWFLGLVSATKVRNAVKEGYCLMGIVTPKMIEYINKHGLYRFHVNQNEEPQSQRAECRMTSIASNLPFPDQCNLNYFSIYGHKQTKGIMKTPGSTQKYMTLLMQEQ